MLLFPSVPPVGRENGASEHPTVAARFRNAPILLKQLGLPDGLRGTTLALLAPAGADRGAPENGDSQARQEEKP